MKLSLPSFLLSTAVVTLVAAGCATHSAAKLKSIEEIMEEGFKGKESLASRISKGQGNDADFALMANLTAQLKLNHAPRGDLKSWTEKTTALNLAAIDLVKGKAGAVVDFKSAVNCKACHSLHKPE